MTTTHGSNPPPTLSFTFAAIGLWWLCIAMAQAPYWPIYASGQYTAMVVVTVLAGSAIAVAGAQKRWSSLVVMLVTFGAFLLLGVPLAVPSKAIGGVLPSLDGLLDVLSGVALGWKQLLTISLPVGNYQALLVPVFALLLVTVVCSLSIALRARASELAVVGPVAFFIVGLLFGPPTATAPYPTTMALIASVLLWLIWRRWYRRRAAVRLLATQAADGPGQPLETVADYGFVGVRSLAAAGVVLAIAAAGGIAATSYAPPAGDRVVLRSAIAQPFDPRDYPSPLSAFRSYLAAGTAHRAMFSVEGLPVGARIRIATMDSYDGIVFSVGGAGTDNASGSFARVPYRLDHAGEGEPVVANITIDGYTGVWVPTVGELVSVEFGGPRAATLGDGFYYNDSTGTAVTVAALGAGDRLRLDAVLPPQPSDSDLARLEPNPIPLPALLTVPDGLVSSLDRYVGSIGGAGERLAAMIAGLKTDGYVSHGIGEDEPASRSGHASDRITELLTAPRMIGDAEQYAVTAALMARELGFPARVVFGFAPDIRATGASIVTGGDVSAWIEVNTSRYGWVAIDPTPPQRPIPEGTPEEPASVARPHTPVQPPVVDPGSSDPRLPPESVIDEQEQHNPLLVVLARVGIVLGWALVVATVLLSPFLTIAAAKWRRRRLRRRAPAAIDRIAGGWQEFEDAVIDHGFSPGPSPTRIEVAQAVGGTQPFVLAAVADRAIFAPGEPDFDQADRVWHSVDELRYALGANLTRRERVKALISLRSLGGYSVSKLFGREGKPR